MRRPTTVIEEVGVPRSVWDEIPWFAISYRHPKLGMSVMITRSWESFSDEYVRLTEAGIAFEVWCGTYRDVEEFRKRAHAPEPHEDDS